MDANFKILIIISLSISIYFIIKERTLRSNSMRFDLGNMKRYYCLWKANSIIIKWAKKKNIPLIQVEYNAIFSKEDISVFLVFFLKTDDDLEVHENNGNIDEIKRQYLITLSEYKCMKELFKIIMFEFDSIENLNKNYSGNIYYYFK